MNPLSHHAGCRQISRGNAFGFAGNRYSRASVSAAAAVSVARFIFEARPPLARASVIPWEIQLSAVEPCHESADYQCRAWTGNTCRDISEVMWNTCLS